MTIYAKNKTIKPAIQWVEKQLKTTNASKTKSPIWSLARQKRPTHWTGIKNEEFNIFGSSVYRKL